MADIGADGPFSAYPGVERWFAVVTGNGVTLDFDGIRRRQVAGDAPLNFAGVEAPGCRLIDGLTRDLNLMFKDGRGAMSNVTTGSWDEAFAMRGLFTATPGRWSGGSESRGLDIHELLWDDGGDPVAWTFVPDDAGATVAGWWIGYSP